LFIEHLRSANLPLGALIDLVENLGLGDIFKPIVARKPT